MKTRSNSADFLENIRNLGQKCLEAVPVIVLGSGASAQYGVRGMGGLQEHLVKSIKPKQKRDEEGWHRFKRQLKLTNDLEATLQRVSLRETLINQIIRETRSMVLADDQEVFSRLVTGKISLSLARLLKYLFNSTHARISVVTTNYDRLAEYAADTAGVVHHTGFSHGYYRLFDEKPDRRPTKTRVTEIWKVHGSIDWFHDANDCAVGLPDMFDVPRAFRPLLVTPGIQKYKITHGEPFRSIIAKADRALANANSYLCVGYGFNDDHIEPKLVQRVRHKDVPIVILARSLSESAKRFLANCKGRYFLALESRENSTVAYHSEAPEGVEIPDCSLWEFGNFLDATI